MAKSLPEDIMLPAGAASERPLTSRLAAFIPISFAVAGVAAILLGGVSVERSMTDGIDPVVTGSISPAHDGSRTGVSDVR